MLVTLAVPTTQINRHARAHPRSATSATDTDRYVVTKNDGQHSDASGTLGEDSTDTASGGSADADDPTKDVLNPYRYSSKRIDVASGGYDMGFRNYDPGLNSFLSRDMYNGALADLSLGMDPWNANRYAFAGGNPISLIELDGHRPVDDQGNPVAGYTTTGVLEAPIVDNSTLQKILGDTYSKKSSGVLGNGKAATALVNELETGMKTKGLYHMMDVADLAGRYADLLELNRKGKINLSNEDIRVARTEFAELWEALHLPDVTGKVRGVH